MDRIQRGHGVLEDHRDVVAADLPQPAGTRRQQVLAVEEGLPARDRVLLCVEAHDREAGDALAGAGLADDSERLALFDAEADPVDSLDDPVVRLKVRLQIVDFEEGYYAPLRCRARAISSAGSSDRSRRREGRSAG